MIVKKKKKKKSLYLTFLQLNSFSFDQIILKLADKVDMDEVLDKFDDCPDQIIYFRVCQLIAENTYLEPFHQHNFNFVQILHIRWG